MTVVEMNITQHYTEFIKTAGKHGSDELVLTGKIIKGLVLSVIRATIWEFTGYWEAELQPHNFLMFCPISQLTEVTAAPMCNISIILLCPELHG